jgi:hypothetical protein
MHDFNDPHSQIDWAAGASDTVEGQECISCRRLFTFDSGMYNRDTSKKYGYELQCLQCKSTPRMSTQEWVDCLTEKNFNSEGTKRQRHRYQDEMRLDRTGRGLECSLFLQKLYHICPRIYVTQGGIKGDLALFMTGPERVEWNNRGFKYMGYVTLGTMPEFSSYEFDDSRDVMIRTKEIGWRQVLLRFIEDGFLSEKQVNQEFGYPSGGQHSTWYRELQRIRYNNSQT